MDRIADSSACRVMAIAGVRAQRTGREFTMAGRARMRACLKLVASLENREKSSAGCVDGCSALLVDTRVVLPQVIDAHGLTTNPAAKNGTSDGVFEGLGDTSS